MIGWEDLARRVGVSAQVLGRRLRGLEAFGYVRRELARREHEPDRGMSPRGQVAGRFTVLRVPVKTDEHDIGAAEPPRAPAPPGSGRRVDPTEVVRLYDGGFSIRAVADELNASYGAVQKIVATHTTARPRGRPRTGGAVGGPR